MLITLKNNKDSSNKEYKLLKIIPMVFKWALKSKFEFEIMHVANTHL